MGTPQVQTCRKSGYSTSLIYAADGIATVLSWSDIAHAPLDARPRKPNRMSIEESGLAMDGRKSLDAMPARQRRRKRSARVGQFSAIWCAVRA